MHFEDEGRYAHQSWWSAWGKPIAIFVLGVLAVVGAIVLALVLTGVLFS